MWYCGPFFGMWWIFPLMFIACIVMMFVVMRFVFMGRFPCCPHHRMESRQQDAGRADHKDDADSRA